MMFSKSFVKRHQPALTALALFLILGIAFSFAPVRALAGDLLGIFRVQKVKVIPVDTSQLEGNEELEGLLAQFAPQSETVVDGGEPVEVADLSQAATLVDFNIAELTALPAEVTTPGKLGILNKSVERVQLDPDLMEAIFEAAGIKIDLPDSLRDTPIIVTRPTMLYQAWGDESDRYLAFTQMNAPQIEYPDDLDLNELGIAVLQFFGKSKAEAMAMSATIDWANTLILHLPSDADAQVSEVSINGASGTLFQTSSAQETMLMWQKDGKTYLLNGSFEAEQLVEMAKSVR